MPQLSSDTVRLRMIDWHNWKKEIPRARARILRYKKKIKELEEELAREREVVAEREKRIRELEDENKRLKGSRRKLQKIVFKDEEKQETIKKRGAKNGHKGSVRRKPKQEDITKRETVELEQCPDCSAILPAPYGWRERYCIDIPPPKPPEVTEFRCGRYHCTACGHWVQGQPPGLFGKSPFGINLIMKVLDMKYRGKDTDAYIRESLQRWYGIDLSDGGIHAILNRAATLFGPAYEAIRKALCEGKVVQADETGWRVAGENWYAWAFLNEEVTYFQIENTRGGGIPKETLNDFSGTVVHDAYQGYNAVENVEHAICGVHFLRHTRDFADGEDASTEAKEFHRQMTWFFRTCRKRKKRCTSDEEHQALHEQMTTALERYWKDRTYDDPLVEATRSWWLEKRGAELLTFLKYAEVPWDNNAAERAVRPMVRRRKVTGGSRSARGAEREAINMSCITTLLKQGKDIFEEVPLLWRMAMASASS